MMKNSGSRKLTVMMLLFGIAALAMRKALYATAVDAKGLLLRNHPLGIGLTVLSVGTLLYILAAVRKTDRTQTAEVTGLFAAGGSLAAGAGILMTVLAGTAFPGGSLESAWYYLGLAAPACLLLAGIAHLLGKKPFFLLHVAVCLFFMVHIVSHYQLWSADPQLQDYVFSMLGAMALLFFSFYTAAREADCGNERMRLGTGLAAIYLCLAELARSACPALYLGGLLWVLTQLISEKEIHQ